jgi:hypothetical protein
MSQSPEQNSPPFRMPETMGEVWKQLNELVETNPEVLEQGLVKVRAPTTASSEDQLQDQMDRIDHMRLLARLFLANLLRQSQLSAEQLDTFSPTEVMSASYHKTSQRQLADYNDSRAGIMCDLECFY